MTTGSNYFHPLPPPTTELTPPTTHYGTFTTEKVIDPAARCHNLYKIKIFANKGIRTLAQNLGLASKASALDHSAILADLTNEENKWYTWNKLFITGNNTIENEGEEHNDSLTLGHTG